MAEQPLDPETIAAFLDGRLPDHERASVLARLSVDPEWRDIAADAAAMVSQVHEIDAAIVGRASGSSAVGGAVETPVVSMAARRSARRGIGPWLVLAAAACVAVVLLARQPAGPPAQAGGRTPAAVQALALALPPEDVRALTTQRWSVVRAGTSAVSETARAVRLGALSVDALLDRTGGGTEARLEMVELLQPLNGSVASQLLRAATDSASHAQAFLAVRALVAADAYDVGVGLELLRAGDASVRDPRDVLDALEHVGARESWPAEQRAQFNAQVRRLAEQWQSVNRADVRETASALLAVLAS